MKLLRYVVMTLVAMWAVWAYYGRSPKWTGSDPALLVTESLVQDTICTRNVVGIQPYMVPADYLSEEHFYQKLKTYFDAAQKVSYFRTNTVVLLPEYLGTWLVIAGEKQTVANAETVSGAMAILVASNPLMTLRHAFQNQGEADRMAATIFRMKARQMAAIYGTVFMRLAREYAVTINAGSIVLPGPRVESNTILVDLDAPLYNTTFVFHPQGAIDGQLVMKSFPISSEMPFIIAAPIEQLQVYELSIGKTALLVCADSWYPESYARIQELGAEVVLVNSYCAGEAAMSQPWRGYDGGNMPGDVDTAHVGTLTEREAWMAHALPGRIASSGARIGVNIFLRGQLWDLGTDGQPFFVVDGKLLEATPSDQAGIWNLCF